METESWGKAIFLAVFVGIAMFLIYYLIPNSSLIIKILISSATVIVGSWIGGKLFPISHHK